MNKILNKILYYYIYFWLYLHALLPFKALYILSDILYFIAYKLIRYRKSVVRKNLSSSFPEKTDKERLDIEKTFYHHLCDYFVETIKLFHISDDEISKRMRFENMDILAEGMKNGRSGIMFLGHYCNWEWVTSLNLKFKDTNVTLGQIYKPLANKAFDDIFLKLRSRFHSIGISKNKTLRSIVNLQKEGKQTLIGFIADQTPAANNIHYWRQFLNQDTPVFTGVERIAKQTDFVVFYLDLQKVKRGHYVGTIKLITDNPKAEPEFSITDKYVDEMEKTILRNPAYWLWTHKRWKRTREEVAKTQHKDKS